MATYKEFSKEFCDKNLNHIVDFNTHSFHVSADKILVDLEWLLKTAHHLAYDNPLTVGQCVSKVNGSFVEYAVVKDITAYSYKCMKVSMYVNGKSEIEGCAVSNCGTIQFSEAKEWSAIEEKEFDKNLELALITFGNQSNLNISIS